MIVLLVCILALLIMAAGGILLLVHLNGRMMAQGRDKK